MQAKQLDLTFVRFCNEKAEVTKCKAKDRVKRKRKRKITSSILGLLLFIALIVGVCIKVYNTQPRYAIASETENYTYVTEKLCEVVNISESENITTISYKGNEYDFYGNGYEIGQEIICQFTDGMEIVGVIE